MKKMKKLISFMLAAIMVLAMSIPVLANGVTVNITLPDDERLEGHEFTAYQIFTGTQTEDAEDNKLASVEWASEIDSAKFLADLKGLENSPFADCDSARDVAEALEKIAEDTATLEKVAQLAYKRVTGEGTKLEAGTNEMPAGYYVIIDTTENIGEDGVRNAALLAATKDVAVQVKTDKPSLDKTITETNDPNFKFSNGAIGDEVNFQLKSTVPNMTHYVDYKFVVDDVMSKGLTFNNDVKVTIGGTDVTTEVKVSTPTLGTEFAGTQYEGGTAIHIVFTDFFENHINDAGKEIIITYKGTINTDAVIGVAGNPNEARLQYSNNPNEVGTGNPDDFDGTEPSGKTPWSETRTYVAAVELFKTGEDGTTALPGAQFQITGIKLNTTLVTGIEYVVAENGKYWKLTDDSFTDVDPTTQGLTEEALAKYADKDTRYEKNILNREVKEEEAVNATAEVGEDGILRIEGLAEGDDYEITEIMAPNGYNLLAKPIKLTITCTYPTDAGKTECVWGGTYDMQTGDDGKGNLEFKTVKDADGVETGVGVLSFTVKNLQGSLLPSTGGIGTTIFYVVGAILVIGAGVLLITRKRMSKEQ